MKYLIKLMLLLPLFAVQSSFAQNSPLSIWGDGLDGSVYQKTAIYSQFQTGLLFEAPLDPSGNRLPIEFNWRGGGNNTALKILPNKYVGIGTANPDNLLTLRGENPTVDIQSTADGQRPGLSMRYQNSAYAGSNIYYYTADANTYFDNLYSNTAGTIYGSFNFRSRDEQSQLTSRLFLNGQNGNVGIGTVNPTEKLAVNGKIRAKEIKVEASNWPDYVFEEGYKVGTLEGLESYIKANKHLPEMPSAREIETNGLVLGEVVKLQQKKIEELTLHLIEKDKELRNIAAKQKEMETLLKKLTENK
ncbi:hypothetical protein [Pedobacter kyungheensis]|uniref:hypothetical protein n=1 Tax=Pedobacter kyungheensis TaxID=1069985 RepID=UPI00068F36BB|nr:hypothetical protein [Pedobacter kyungheensis]